MRWLSVLAVLQGVAYADDATNMLMPGASAMTAEPTDVASSADGPNVFDIRIRMGYSHFEKRASIKRESIGAPTQDTVNVFKDLYYQQSRDTIKPRVEIGLWHDLMVHLEMPIVIGETSLITYDQTLGDSCVYPPQANPTCVNATNSTTVRDGLVPMAGFDATNGGMPLSGNQLFRGANRGAKYGSGLDGFDTLNIGLTWGALSQQRDRSKPNWIVGFEAQVSIGNIKQFDRAMADANHAVSEGVHRFLFKTSLSRRFRFFEPYWSLWYMLPVARGDSLFKDYGPAVKVKLPQMQAGTVFGTDIVPYERKDKSYRVALDLRGRVEAHFKGRGYSEIWEMLASASPLACDMSTSSFNPACDSSQTTNLYQGRAFTGLTTISDYATIGADIAIQAQIGRYFRIRSGFEYSHDEAHFITGDDIGTPMNPTGRVMSAQEFNPAYRAIIDQVGRRFIVDNVNTYNFYIYAQAMF
jgi:hypothetical protein